MYIFVLSLIIFVFAANPNKCSSLSGPKAYRCIQHLNEIRELAYSIDIYDKESSSKINKPCAEFQKCSEPLKCGVEDGVVKVIDKMTAYCDAVIFHQSKEFDDCDEKLTEKNSTCVQEWDPFPDPVPDTKKTEEMQKEACQNFFGKDMCLEKEITEYCGVLMWHDFKKHYLALNKVNEACDFNEYGSTKAMED
ncbi:hypothetical protein GCK72_018939 [Caenorhabditis remanei]|uniref:T20D4.11-like domain-containing protein n=1 Tax=Caenorhabditis remanei TaxID=31234 RepID=A0A6A5GCF8_CAERE|nr:hypothetical protein GCK72_018939 [Caenorhabditis remanei]KAF1752384.1 hypothetical protein GCK72_018939 [Caenorhabditis remanei]